MFRMAATVSAENKKMLKRLLECGRWNNYSEIIRYGIDLVRREVEREELAPYPKSVLEKAYEEMSEEDRAADSRLGKASSRPKRGELD